MSAQMPGSRQKPADSMAAMGLPPGTYRLGNVSVIVEEKDGTLRATRQGSDTLAGAVVTMDECVRRYREYCDASVVEAVEAFALDQVRPRLREAEHAGLPRLCCAICPPGQLGAE